MCCDISAYRTMYSHTHTLTHSLSNTHSLTAEHAGDLRLREQQRSDDISARGQPHDSGGGEAEPTRRDVCRSQFGA